ncbi:MAG TPA: hypothetical protein VFV93_04670 [Thermomicrobiales bacterium]|nr:hypothetical protein [Thermomicrobiales bacterium]
MLQILRVVAVALFTLVAGSVGYAYASSNSGLTGAGGDGAGQISGYQISDVSYTLNALDPTRIDAVSFDIDAGDSSPDVMVSLVRDGGAWHDCTVSTASAPARATCQMRTPVAVVDVDELRVVAAQ